jgi:5-oxopent-3-ene-1,2,5-tricarboxylate decarboxylase/2-hydroxyhepta-2,4-diene-1,7-dioate isomerase
LRVEVVSRRDGNPALTGRGWFGNTVYAAALNFRGALEALGDKTSQDPYKAPPQAPVLYIKPPNTWSTPGAKIVVPGGTAQLKMGGTLGIVIGRAASRVSESEALDYVSGWVVVNDVSIPHESYFRPAIKQRCRDGFCPMGAIAHREALDPSRAHIQIFVNGELKAEANTTDLIRPVPKLIADVTEFMTLRTGDVLLIGEPDNAPLAALGDQVRVEIQGIGSIENTLEAE